MKLDIVPSKEFNSNTRIPVNFVDHRMDIHLARSLTAALRDDKCIFGYSGHFPDEHSARLIELGEAVHCSCDKAVSTKGRLGYVMVEAYQNIVRHRAFPSGGSSWGKGRSMFLLRCRADGHIMKTRNPVTLEQHQKLEERLTELYGKDTSELKELFLEGIQRTSPPGTRGAGLGLIEMVRRAGEDPKWGFDPLDQSHFLFKLALELGDTGAPTAETLAQEEELPALMLEHRISSFYTGFWSHDVQKAMLGLVREERFPETHDSTERTTLAGRVGDVLYTSLGPDRAMVLILHAGEHPMLSMGGVMANAKLDQLTKTLQDTDVRICSSPADAEGTVLAMVQIPW